MLKSKIGYKSFLGTFAVSFGSLVLLGFLASIYFSKSYWGYFFDTPGLPKKVLEFEEILSVTRVSSQEQDNPSLSRSPESLNWCESEPEYQLGESGYCGGNRCYSGYCDSSRILLALFERGKLTTRVPEMSAARLASVYGYTEATSLLYEGDPGYEDGKWLEGMVVEAKDSEGEGYLFVAVNGRQIKNDVYPYYEFLFLLPEEGVEPQLLEFNRFLYEIAGFEGILVWPVVWIFLVAIGFLPCLLVSFLWWRVKQR